MPSSIILAAAYVVGFVSEYYALSTIFAIAVNFAISYSITRVYGSKPPKRQDNGVRQQVPPSADNSLPVVYGEAWMGGTFVDAALTTDNQAMYYVLAISNISPNGQFTYDTTQFYYGDRLITFAPGTNQVASLTDGAGNVDTKINGYFFINLYTSDAAGNITTVLGSAPNVAMGGVDLPANLRWPASGRQMNGLAFAIVYLKYSQDAGSTGLQPVTFKVKHALNGTGVAKPGSVLKDYLNNSIYGGAVDIANINTAACDALDAYSDQLISYTPSGGGSPVTQPRYRINGVIDTGETVLNNVEQILMACDSWIAYQAESGQWSPVINKAEPSTFAFDDSNIIGEIRVSATDITSSINQIEASFPWNENKDKPGFLFLKTPPNLRYPNEPDNKYTTSFDMVNNSVQAQYLANRMLEQAREDLIVSFNTAYTGIQVNAGDVINITNAAYGWNSKLFRVVKVNETSLPDGNLGARIECNEYNAQVYDDKDITEFVPAPNSDLQSAYYFPALNAPTFADQAPGAQPPTFSVICQLPSTVRVTQVTLYYTTSTTPTTADWRVWGVESASNAAAFDPGLSLKFPNVNLSAGTYYFAFSVGNEVSTSQLSATSAAFVWNPLGGQAAFVASFAPAAMSVPRANGTPSFTGLIAKLYGTEGATEIQFVTAQTDSDASFVNSSWRIGGSSTTGNADITTTGGLVLGAITDGGTWAQWGIPTAMTSSPATLTVPVRFKNSNGVITQAAAASLQWIFVDQGLTGPTGSSGTQTGTAYLYQWATVQPGNPSGTSTFTWATATNSGYTGGNGWATTISANPGIPGIYLWIASKAVTDTATATTTTVSWASGYQVYASTGNGLTGAKTAKPTVYQWAATIPTISGTSTYTWSSGAISPVPAGWSTSITTSPSAGFTLWAASVNLLEPDSATTSTINWTTASILASGYAGVTGPTGTTGPTGSGTAGASARLCFARVAGNPTPVAGNIVTSGSASFPSSAESSATWGFAATWVASDPNPSSTNSLYQSDGIYNPVTNQTTWSTPYISSLKVGTLSAITVNTGALTVQDSITVSTTGKIFGGQTDYNTGTGFFLGYSGGAYKFSIGNSSGARLTWDGTTLTLGGATNINVSGTGSFTGSTASIGSGQFSAVYGNGSTNDVHGVFGETDAAGVAGVRGDNTSSTASSYGLWGVAGGIGCRAQGTSSTAFGGYFTAQTLVNGLYASGGRIAAQGTLRWDDSSTPSTAGIGAYIETDNNNALYLISGASGSADPKAVIFGTKATSRARVDSGYVRPEVDNVMTLGAGSFRYVDVYAVSGSVNTSDEREKNILGANPLGLNFINKLQTIQYKWKIAQAAIVNNIVDEEGNVIGQQEEVPAREGVRTFHGLSAQQVKAALDDLGIPSFAGWVLANKDDPNSTQGLRYSEFIAPLIKAVQELSQKVADLEARLK